MNFYSYEQYSKAIVPLVLAVGRFLQGWIESGILERGELADVVGLLILAVLIFLMPNRDTPKETKPPARKQTNARAPKGEPR